MSRQVMATLKQPVKLQGGSSLGPGSELAVVGREERGRGQPDWLVCWAGDKIGVLLYVDETEADVKVDVDNASIKLLYSR